MISFIKKQKKKSFEILYINLCHVKCRVRSRAPSTKYALITLTSKKINKKYRSTVPDFIADEVSISNAVMHLVGFCGLRLSVLNYFSLVVK